MDITLSEYDRFSSIYVKADKETISKITLFASQLNAEEKKVVVSNQKNEEDQA